MKIRDAKVLVCCPGRNFVTLKIQTDEGVYGLGDATLNGREMAAVSYLSDHVIPCLVGRDPFQTEDIWQYLYRGWYLVGPSCLAQPCPQIIEHLIRDVNPKWFHYNNPSWP